MTAKIFLSAVAFSMLLWAADSDFDGVGDAVDRCPNTPMEAIVDATGCPQTTTPISLSASMQQSSGTYGGSDTITTRNALLSLGYQTQTFGFGVTGSYYRSGSTDPNVVPGSQSGLGDTYLNASYTQTIYPVFSVTYYATMKLATASTDLGTGAHDYSAGATANWQQDTWNIFATLGYTITGDTDTATYNDIKNMAVGLGKSLSKAWYLSGSYLYSDGYIDGSVATQSIALMGSYTHDQTWFASANYGYGLSTTAADHAVGITVGRYF